MRKRLATLHTLALIVISAIAYGAHVPPAIVSEGKKATALVEISGGRGFASAFCIDASDGIFVTNQHVVEGLGANGSVTLIVHSGESNQQKLKAIVVRSDADLDLALLRVKEPKQLTALMLGSVDDLIETASVTAFGYPFGKDLALSDDSYPNVTVSTGHITSLRKVQGTLAAIQLDAQLNPGNSGGPVLNDKGRVVGIVVAGIEGTGIDFAIPVSHLEYFLSSAAIDFTPPNITDDSAHAPNDFAVHVSMFHRSLAGISVSLTLSSGQDDHRTVTATQAENQTFTLHASPLPGPKGPKMLHVSAEDSNGKLSFMAPDQNVFLGGKPVLLSTIREVNRSDGTQVLLADKEIRTETVSGLDRIETRVSGATGHSDLSRATLITIESADSARPTVSYHIVVRQNGSVIGEKTGKLSISESHVASTTLAAGGGSAKVSLLLCSFNTNAVKRFNGLTGDYIDDFAAGNGLQNPVDATIGPDGNLYVSGHGSDTIHRYNGRTGKFIDVFVPKARNGGVIGANGVAFGPDGNLYVSSKWTSEVKRFDGKTGGFLDNFVTRGSGRLAIPAQIAWFHGNLFVASSDNSCIKEYDGKTGAYIKDAASGNGIRNPIAFCFGPDGLLYASSCVGRQIMRFNVDTGQFIDDFINADALGNDPHGIEFGPDGNIYVVTMNNDVKRFNGKTGRFIDVFVSGNNIDKPICMIFSPDTHR